MKVCHILIFVLVSKAIFFFVDKVNDFTNNWEKPRIEAIYQERREPTPKYGSQQSDPILYTNRDLMSTPKRNKEQKIIL